MNGSKFHEINEAKGFAVNVSNDLRLGKLCSVVKTANRLIGYFGRTFNFKSEKMLFSHY